MNEDDWDSPKREARFIKQKEKENSSDESSESDSVSDQEENDPVMDMKIDEKALQSNSSVSSKNDLGTLKQDTAEKITQPETQVL